MLEVNMASQAAVTGKRWDHIFYTGLAVVAAAIVFAGFARTYYLKDLFGKPPLPSLLHLHGALFTSWLLSCLVRSRWWPQGGPKFIGGSVLQGEF
jgi:hypothetical protein